MSESNTTDDNIPLRNAERVVQADSVEDFDDWIEKEQTAIGIEPSPEGTEVHIFDLRGEPDMGQEWYRMATMTDDGATQLQAVLNEAYPTTSTDEEGNDAK